MIVDERSNNATQLSADSDITAGPTTPLPITGARSENRMRLYASRLTSLDLSQPVVAVPGVQVGSADDVVGIRDVRDALGTVATTEFVVLSLQQGMETFHFLDPVSMRGCSGQALPEPTSDSADRHSSNIEAVAIFLNGARAIAVFAPANGLHPQRILRVFVQGNTLVTPKTYCRTATSPC